MDGEPEKEKLEPDSTSSSSQNCLEGMSQARLGSVLCSPTKLPAEITHDSMLSPTVNTLSARTVPPHAPANEIRDLAKDETFQVLERMFFVQNQFT